MTCWLMDMERAGKPENLLIFDDFCCNCIICMDLLCNRFIRFTICVCGFSPVELTSAGSANSCRVSDDTLPCHVVGTVH